MSRPVFDRKQTGVARAVVADDTFSTMRNRRGQQPGIPLDYGYRPADRPMAEHLGRGFAGDGRLLGTGNTDRVPEGGTFWRNRVSGVKTFSWEQGA